jgi:hypothetical protein
MSLPKTKQIEKGISFLVKILDAAGFHVDIPTTILV